RQRRRPRPAVPERRPWRPLGRGAGDRPGEGEPRPARDGRAGDGRRPHLGAGGPVGVQLPQRQRPTAAVWARRGDRLRPDRGDVAGWHPGGVPGGPGRPLGGPDARFGEAAMNRTLLAATVVLVASVAIAS